MSSHPSGVVVPEVDGRRSSTALGRAVVADALRSVDPVGAASVERETDWRRGYLVPFRRLVEAGLTSREAELRIAGDGLDSLAARMRYADAEGDRPLGDTFAHDPDRSLGTVTVAGTGEVETELSVPLHGQRLRGDALLRQLDAWVAAGTVEPSFAEAVRQVARHPEWLRIADRRVVALGAGAEMGPLLSLLRWGGEVVAVDLPRPDLWRRLLEQTRRFGGRMHVPVAVGQAASDSLLASRAGADLLHELPDVAAWLAEQPGPLVLGNYVYADGVTNLRVSTAVDALSSRLLDLRDDVALAFLATPTDVFAVPDDVVAEAERRYRERSLTRTLRRPLRAVSGGRLLRRHYAPGTAPGLTDALVPQQGPNYALAKRLQRWRAAVARAAGVEVSLAVAPPTRTRSVVRNRALAAAYAGAGRFGVEVFEPGTANTLMAAKLVHDLCAGTPRHEHPWQDEAWGAAHGGLWRQPYDPRSVLGIAVLLGWGSARG
ncbi:MAG: hypothetical protein ACLGIV_09145 [Actinomycetes bacterium]